MTEERAVPPAGRRRRRLRRAGVTLALVVGLPALVFGLSNAWLATPSGRGWLGERIEHASGMPAEVGLAWWSPWAGLTLRNVELRVPAAAGPPGADGVVARVGRIEVLPRWNQLLRGKVSPARIEVDDPVLSLPVDLLVAAARSAGAQSSGVEQPQATGPATQQPEPAAPTTEPAPLVPVPPTPEFAPTPVATRPTCWLVVRRGQLRVGGHGDGGPVLALDGINADVPVRGRPAVGSVKISGGTLAGQSLGATEVPLKWEAPRLSADDWRPIIGGLNLDVRAEARLVGACPFAAALAIPQQAITAGSEGDEIRGSAGHLAGFAQLAGYARFPSSWAGNAAVDAVGVELTGTGVPGRVQRFDRCGLRAVVRGGEVRVNDARAIGDSLSLLGNGLLVADGRVEGVVRVVVPEETAVAADTALTDSGLDATAEFRPLGTRDRWYLDCGIEGRVDDPEVRVGGGEPRRFDEWVATVRGRVPGT